MKNLILQIFDPRKLTIIDADIFNLVLESDLRQQNELRNLYLIAFYSCKFTESELNYEIYDKELLVIIKAFKQ